MIRLCGDSAKNAHASLVLKYFPLKIFLCKNQTVYSKNRKGFWFFFVSILASPQFFFHTFSLRIELQTNIFQILYHKICVLVCSQICLIQRPIDFLFFFCFSSFQVYFETERTRKIFSLICICKYFIFVFFQFSLFRTAVF